MTRLTGALDFFFDCWPISLILGMVGLVGLAGGIWVFITDPQHHGGKSLIAILISIFVCAGFFYLGGAGLLNRLIPED